VPPAAPVAERQSDHRRRHRFVHGHRALDRHIGRGLANFRADAFTTLPALSCVRRTPRTAAGTDCRVPAGRAHRSSASLGDRVPSAGSPRSKPTEVRSRWEQNSSQTTGLSEARAKRPITEPVSAVRFCIRVFFHPADAKGRNVSTVSDLPPTLPPRDCGSILAELWVIRSPRPVEAP
jgi:hypothetical protein